MNLYINGQPDVTISDANLVFWESSPREVAREFNGRIDDLRIYNRALSPSEVLNVYSSVIPEPTSVALLLLGAPLAWLARRRRV
jgi:hypothetical protein